MINARRDNSREYNRISQGLTFQLGCTRGQAEFSRATSLRNHAVSTAGFHEAGLLEQDDCNRVAVQAVAPKAGQFGGDLGKGEAMR